VALRKQVGAVCRTHGSGRDSSLEYTYRPQGFLCLTRRAAPSEN